MGLVMIDRDDHPDVSCDRVVTDDVEVGRLATAHLVAQGRRAIAHVTGTPVVHARRRAQGYRAALKDARMKARREWIVRGGFKEADGYRAMRSLLRLEPPIDAVFAANDASAIGVMKAVWDAGLRVPEDIAVVGAGDIALGDLLRVPLTTISWSRDEQGKAAAALLFERIDQPSASRPGPARRTVIPPRLVQRLSSGTRESAEK
jgi:LacI family transcriptional regulator